MVFRSKTLIICTLLLLSSISQAGILSCFTRQKPLSDEVLKIASDVIKIQNEESTFEFGQEISIRRTDGLEDGFYSGKIIDLRKIKEINTPIDVKILEKIFKKLARFKDDLIKPLFAFREANGYEFLVVSVESLFENEVKKSIYGKLIDLLQNPNENQRILSQFRIMGDSKIIVIPTLETLNKIIADTPSIHNQFPFEVINDLNEPIFPLPIPTQKDLVFDHFIRGKLLLSYSFRNFILFDLPFILFQQTDIYSRLLPWASIWRNIENDPFLKSRIKLDRQKEVLYNVTRVPTMDPNYEISLKDIKKRGRGWYFSIPVSTALSNYVELTPIQLAEQNNVNEKDLPEVLRRLTHIFKQAGK